MDRKLANALVLPCNAQCLLFNLRTDVVEICETFIDVEELAPFCVCWCRVRYGRMDKLEDKWTSGDDA